MSDSTLLKAIYRFLTWSLLAALAVVFVLMLRKSPPPAVPVDSAAAARAEQKFARADQAKATGQSRQAVTLDRTELNSYLAQNLQTQGPPDATGASSSQSATPSAGSNAATTSQPSDPLAALNSSGATLDQVQSSVKDVKVDMDGDLVKAYVVFDFHGKDLSLELDGHLGAHDGYLKFVPVAGKLGEMPLPQSMLESVVDKMMASPENREKLRLPDDVSDIQIVNGQAVVSYK